MEMKDDIAGKPQEAQFHKIYIQQHDNVRYVTSVIYIEKKKNHIIPNDSNPFACLFSLIFI